MWPFSPQTRILSPARLPCLLHCHLFGLRARAVLLLNQQERFPVRKQKLASPATALFSFVVITFPKFYSATKKGLSCSSLASVLWLSRGPVALNHTLWPRTSGACVVGPGVQSPGLPVHTQSRALGLAITAHFLRSRAHAGSRRFSTTLSLNEERRSEEIAAVSTVNSPVLELFLQGFL